MFSNFYHLGNSIELFNLHNKNLYSKWHFEGKYSKLFDPSLKCYEMILSTGNLSKMLIPKTKKNSKIKTLSIFQGYVVFQLYLFTSKQFSIELAISDTTNAKRRLIFSSNNDNLVLNQLHCRIPIFELPIGKLQLACTALQRRHTAVKLLCAVGQAACARSKCGAAVL